MKAKSLGGAGSGVPNRIEMPRFMKGVVKSTAFSRSDVMVRSVMAKSMSCNKHARRKHLNLSVFIRAD